MNNFKKLFLIICTFSLLILGVSIGFANVPLQTQYGPNGLEVDLLRAKSSGKFLTLVFKCRGTGEAGKTVRFYHEKVNFVDEDGAKKYHVLKDSEGDWMVSDPSSSYILLDLKSGESNVIWYKFPLPPENVKKISVHIPEVSPFEDVEIER